MQVMTEVVNIPVIIYGFRKVRNQVIGSNRQKKAVMKMMIVPRYHQIALSVHKLFYVFDNIDYEMSDICP